MTRAMPRLFMAGSTCFAVGSFPLYFQNVDALAVALTFFVGSLLFTTAAYLQFRLEVDGARFAWRPHDLGWAASAIQLVGTLAFNASTFFAIDESLDVSAENHLVWAPDAVGSIAFLTASATALVVVHRDAMRTDRDRTIGGLNMVGSVLFGLAALGARTLTTTGEPANVVLVNVGTLLGALCFFAGAALLLPSHDEAGAAAH
jgi:hypothetical protein